MAVVGSAHGAGGGAARQVGQSMIGAGGGAVTGGAEGGASGRSSHNDRRAPRPAASEQLWCECAESFPFPHIVGPVSVHFCRRAARIDFP